MSMLARRIACHSQVWIFTCRERKQSKWSWVCNLVMNDRKRRLSSVMGTAFCRLNLLNMMVDLLSIIRLHDSTKIVGCRISRRHFGKCERIECFKKRTGKTNASAQRRISSSRAWRLSSEKRLEIVRTINSYRHSLFVVYSTCPGDISTWLSHGGNSSD